MKYKKFKSVDFNNKKKELYLYYYGGKEITLHYSDLGFKELIKEAWVDKDTKGASIGFLFPDGSEDYMPYDQPLYIKRDPEYLLQTHIENLVLCISEGIVSRKVSKKYLARQLGTSDNQIQRLLDPNILNKNLIQLYKLASLLQIDMKIEAA